jgi:hypothetical protein
MSKKEAKATQGLKKSSRIQIYVALIGAIAIIGAAIITGFFSLLDKEPQIDQQSVLEITSLTATDQSELDVQVRNIGSTEALITELTVSIVEDTGKFVLPILQPSARYELPIGDLREGQARSIHISHAVGANKADRFLVALDTTRILKVKLTLTYNRNQTVSDTAWLWGWCWVVGLD